ncbi:hypothetical protein [Streptomyces sp. 8K308]|uniref:hypothetical protein n=1 Tax=Streptomyces sp. 8K308 TaxID=2530388 RepID=UPI0014046FD9|nr:hypothetical protein [Streptomyces sp. 8K308]
MAQLPAVNPTQFSWVLSRMRGHPCLVPPAHQAEVAACGALEAVDGPGGADYGPRGVFDDEAWGTARSCGCRGTGGLPAGAVRGCRWQRAAALSSRWARTSA